MTRAALMCPECRYDVGVPPPAVCSECGVALKMAYVRPWVVHVRRLCRVVGVGAVVVSGDPFVWMGFGYRLSLWRAGMFNWTDLFVVWSVGVILLGGGLVLSSFLLRPSPPATRRLLIGSAVVLGMLVAKSFVEIVLDVVWEFVQ